jgi:hypothetical protein
MLGTAAPDLPSGELCLIGFPVQADAGSFKHDPAVDGLGRSGFGGGGGSGRGGGGRGNGGCGVILARLKLQQDAVHSLCYLAPCFG